MPISPLHLGPAVLQKAISPDSTDLRLYVVMVLAIDAEPIIKGASELAGFAQFEALHTWTHTPWGLALIVLACAAAWFLLGLATRRAALWTAAGAGFTHWLLDSLMHGGGDMPELFNTHGYGTDIAHGIVAWCFLIGGVLLLLEHRHVVAAWLRRELKL